MHACLRPGATGRQVRRQDRSHCQCLPGATARYSPGALRGRQPSRRGLWAAASGPRGLQRPAEARRPPLPGHGRSGRTTAPVDMATQAVPGDSARCQLTVAGPARSRTSQPSTRHGLPCAQLPGACSRAARGRAGLGRGCSPDACMQERGIMETARVSVVCCGSHGDLRARGQRLWQHPPEAAPGGAVPRVRLQAPLPAAVRANAATRRTTRPSSQPSLRCNATAGVARQKAPAKTPPRPDQGRRTTKAPFPCASRWLKPS